MKQNFMMYTRHGKDRFHQRCGYNKDPQKVYLDSVKLTSDYRYNYEEGILLSIGRNNKVVTVLTRNKRCRLRIEPVTRKDYKGIALALRNKKDEIDYITPKHIKEDIEQERLFCIREEGKIVCIGALVFDERHNATYIKRVMVLNKKNEGKGYAKKMIRDLSRLQEKVCITPYRDNEPMIKILVDLGFKLIKTFGENFLLYQKNRNGGVLV